MTDFPKYVPLHASQVSQTPHAGPDVPARAWSFHWPVDRVHLNRADGVVSVLVENADEEAKAQRDLTAEADSVPKTRKAKYTSEDDQ